MPAHQRQRFQRQNTSRQHTEENVRHIEKLAKQKFGSERDRKIVNPYDYIKQGIVPGRLQQLDTHKRKQTMYELQRIQQIMDSRGEMKRNRDMLPKEAKEIHDLRMLFFNALAEGEIRNMGEFHDYLQKWLNEMHKNPKMVAYAKTAVKKLERSFNPQQIKALQKRFKNLAIIARGGDPYD